MGIKDIAKRAGVSPTTVSLALNGHKGVSQSTRTEILRIAEEMHYRVPTQRSYSHPFHGVIVFAKVHKHGLILNKDQNTFIMDYIDGINPLIREAGYTFEILDLRVEDMVAFTDFINEKNPDGLVFLGTEHDSDDISYLSRLKIPYVVMDAYYNFLGIDFIDMNNAQGVNEVLKYLSSNGFRDITMITSRKPTSNIKMRENYFLSSYSDFGIEPAEAVYAVSPGFDGAYQDINEWLKEKDSLPEALFCYNDVAAYGVIKALKENKIKVPGDIAVVGFDDLPMSAMIQPHLTTIRVPNRQIGETAARSIIEKISNNGSQSSTATLVSVELIVRDSATAVEDKEV